MRGSQSHNAYQSESSGARSSAAKRLLLLGDVGVGKTLFIQSLIENCNRLQVNGDANQQFQNGGSGQKGVKQDVIASTIGFRCDAIVLPQGPSSSSSSQASSAFFSLDVVEVCGNRTFHVNTRKAALTVPAAVVVLMYRTDRRTSLAALDAWFREACELGAIAPHTRLMLVATSIDGVRSGRLQSARSGETSSRGVLGERSVAGCLKALVDAGSGIAFHFIRWIEFLNTFLLDQPLSGESRQRGLDHFSSSLYATHNQNKLWAKIQSHSRAICLFFASIANMFYRATLVILSCLLFGPAQRVATFSLPTEKETLSLIENDTRHAMTIHLAMESPLRGEGNAASRVALSMEDSLSDIISLLLSV